MLQTQWTSQLNPLLSQKLTQGNYLTGITIDPSTGPNSINHGLGRPLIGWILTRLRAQATVWDLQDANIHPELTLTLNATATVTVDIYVY